MPQEYAKTGPLYAKPDYYTRIFSRQFDPKVELTKQDYRTAEQALIRFDLSLILERPTSFEVLGRRLGWTKKIAYRNKLKSPWRHRLKLFSNGQVSAATRSLFARQIQPTDALRTWFRQQSGMDLCFYEAGVRKFEEYFQKE